jgi:hypothetical protein
MVKQYTLITQKNYKQFINSIDIKTGDSNKLTLGHTGSPTKSGINFTIGTLNNSCVFTFGITPPYNADLKTYKITDDPRKTVPVGFKNNKFLVDFFEGLYVKLADEIAKKANVLGIKKFKSMESNAIKETIIKDKLIYPICKQNGDYDPLIRIKMNIIEDPKNINRPVTTFTKCVKEIKEDGKVKWVMNYGSYADISKQQDCVLYCSIGYIYRINGKFAPTINVMKCLYIIDPTDSNDNYDDICGSDDEIDSSSIGVKRSREVDCKQVVDNNSNNFKKRKTDNNINNSLNNDCDDEFKKDDYDTSTL